MGDFVFFSGIALGFFSLQIVVNFAFRNNDLVLDFTLTKARNSHLITDFLTKFYKRDTVFLQCIAKLRERHLVAGGNALQSLFKLAIVNAQTGIASALHLHFIHHQAFEHLLLKYITRWQWRALLLELVERDIKTCVQFMQGNYFVVDHGNNTISRKRFIGWALRHLGGCQTDETEEQKQGTKRERHE